MALQTKFQSNVVPVLDGESIDQLLEPVGDVFESARGWIQKCNETHERCKVEETTVLPTRLLSIASDPLKLVLTADLTTRPRYATLSHRWGSNEPSKLTAENLDSRLKALSLKELPKSFTDAVQIARKVELQYLWVDALCIIQDSEEDWLRESSMMSSIYGGSALNIAASSATDASQGCFLTPPYYSGGFRTKTIVNGKERVQDFKDGQAYNRATSESFLATRAWALQERLLATRTIHFGDRGAFWECGTSIASEAFPAGFGKFLVHTLAGLYENVYTRMIDAEVKTAGEDNFGQITHGVLRLGCSAMAVGQLDAETMSEDSDRGRSITITSGDENQRFRVWMDSADDADVNNKPVYLLPIIGGRTGMAHSIGTVRTDVLKVHGMLLQETGASQGEFCRIGSFTFTKNPCHFDCKKAEYNEDYEPFLKILGDSGMKTAETVCTEVVENHKYPKERYVVTVI